MAEPPPPTTPPRRPSPDVPPPPPGHWPLSATAHGPGAPLPRSTSDRDRVRRGAGLGLSFGAIALYFAGQTVAQLLVGITLIAPGVLDPSSFDPEAGGVALLAVASASQVFGLAAVLVLLRRRQVHLTPIVGPLRPLLRSVGVGTGLGLVTVVVSLTVVAVVAGITGQAEPADQLLSGELLQGPAQLLLAVVIAVILAPVAEELLFRGLLHRSLRRRLTLAPATLLSSSAFALVHANVVLSQPVALIGLVLAGAMMAIAYERTGQLVVPIMMHAVYNAVTLLLLVLSAQFDPSLLPAVVQVGP